MPHPRLTPILNNCAPHAVTPEVCAEIKKYANDANYDNQHNPQYQRLKEIFAAFYKFDETGFTWKHFDSILSRYNSFDVQIILGPVLRSFMKHTMAENEMIDSIAEDVSLSREDYIQRFTEIQKESGRYYTIGPHELAAYIAQPLGFSLYYTKDGRRLGDEVPNSIAPVEIYHSGEMEGTANGHWERVADKAQCIDDQGTSTLACLLPLLRRDEPLVITFGLHLLKSLINGAATGNEKVLTTAELSCSQIERYLKMIPFVPQQMVIELLDSKPTKRTELFIEKYPFEPRFSGQVIENALKVPAAIRGMIPLTEYQRQAVQQILSGLSPEKMTKLVDPKFYPRLCEEAREVATNTIDSLTAFRVNFDHIHLFDGIEERADELKSMVRKRIKEAKEKLTDKLQPLNNFSQLDMAEGAKLKQIEEAALARKRELRQTIMDNARFEDCIKLLRENGTKMGLLSLVESNYTEAVDKNQQLIHALIAAKDAFIRENKTLERSKQDFVEACRAAIDAARTVPIQTSPGWGATVPRFLYGLTGGSYSRELSFFSASEHEQQLDQAETGLVKNPIFSPANV